MQLEVPGVDLRLTTRLRGDPDRQPLLVFGHGAGAGVDHPLQQQLAAAMARAGLATLRYQFPFMERQGGSGFGRDPQPVALATVRAAVAAAASRWPRTTLFAGGHSYGGRMTSLAAVADSSEGTPRVDAPGVDAPGVDAPGVDAPGVATPGVATPGLPVAGLVLCSFPLHPPRKPALDRAAHWPQLSQPVLLLSGERDAMALPEPLDQALAAAGPGFRLRRIAAADHGWQVRRRDDPDAPFTAMAAALAEWWPAIAGSPRSPLNR